MRSTYVEIILASLAHKSEPTLKPEVKKKSRLADFGIIGLAAASLLGILPVTSQAAQPVFGAYRWDKYAATDLFSEWVGTPVGIAQSHQPKESWSKIEMEGYQYLGWAKWVKANPSSLFNLSVAPFPENQGASLAACARGDYNHHYKILANRLVANGFKGSILRFGWEFSGKWMPWYANEATAPTFAACFRSFVSTMRSAEPDGNFKFDYNPFADVSQSVIEKAYPGDAYVDFIGIDLYDTSYNGYYAKCPASGCSDAAGMNNWNYSQKIKLKRFVDFAKLHGKSVSIPEWGLVDRARNGGVGGGDNPTFIRNMLKFIQDPNNRVGYHSYFDVNARDGFAQLSGPNCINGDTSISCTLYPYSAAAFLEGIRAGGEQDINFYKKALAANSATATATSTATSTATETNTVTASAVVVNPASPQIGGELNAATNVTASAAENLIVQLAFKNNQTSAVVEMKQFALKAFAANKSEAMSHTFAVPANLSAGAYRVDVAVYNADFKKMYRYQSGGIFNVVSPTYSASSILSSPASLVAGGSLNASGSITASVKETVVPEFVLRAADGTMVSTKKLPAVALAAGVAQTVSTTFDTTETMAPGTYAIDLIVRNADQTKVRAENHNGSISVTAVHKASMAIVNPGSAAIGASFQASSLVSSSGSESMVVEFALRNLASGAVVAKKTLAAKAFQANQAELVSAQFEVPLTFEEGSYAVDTILYSAGMTILKEQYGSALTLIPAIYAASSPALSAKVITAGGQVAATSSISSSVDEALNVEFTLRGSAGVVDTKQLAVANLAAGVAQDLSAIFAIPANLTPGSYTVETIVRNPSLGKVRAQSAATLTVNAIPAVYTTSKGVINPGSVTVGASFNVSTTIVSSVTENLVVQLSLRDISGSRLVEVRNLPVRTFIANQGEAISATFKVPANLAPGAYRVDFAAYTPDYKKTRVYRNDAAFNVVPVVYSANNALVGTGTVIAGGQLAVRSSASASMDEAMSVEAAMIDVNGKEVAKQSLGSAKFLAGQALSFDAAFQTETTLEPGTYSIVTTVRAADMVTIRARSAVSVTITPIVYAASKLAVGSELQRSSGLTLTTNVISPVSENVLVQLIIKNASGKVVDTQRVTGVSLQARIAQAVSKTISRPAQAGKYTVETYVYTPDFKKTRVFRNDGSFLVQ